MELLEINGKTTLVTGVTGDFGEHIARALKQHGQEVTGIGRNESKLEKLNQLNIKTIAVDLKSENEIVAFTKSCDVFDNVVFCHGVNGPRPSRMCNNSFITNVIESNLNSTINLVANIIRNRKIASPGRVVFISSIACHIGATNNAPYSASKGGAEAFLRGVARELLKKEITVNSIAPAAIETSLFEGNKPEVLNAKHYPLGIGEPSDVTNAVLFLILAGSKYITGETLILDGGATWLE